VTEAEWLASNEAEYLIRHITMSSRAARTKAGRRKLRLYACACCRLIWDMIPDDDSRRALEVNEQFADGLVDRAAFQAISVTSARAAQRRWQVAWNTCRVAPGHPSTVRWRAARAVELACEGSIIGAQVAGPIIAQDVSRRGASQEKRMQAVLVRDLYGNPFRPPPLDRRLREWNGGVITGLAEEAYEARELPGGTLDAARLAVLADALEDAGCADAALLGHLRGPGPHVRGCWAVDLLLGKE
jgi:hypothetical protein